MIGQTLSHYKILEEIGAGGMGVVYRAEDMKLKRTIALKFLSSQSLGTQDEKTRFVHEAQAAASLDHLNICTVHEIDEVEGHTFIAMAYIDGLSLREKTQLGPLKLEEALDVAIGVAQGLQEAHEKGIVHRDIKSGNIMLTKKGSAKITDFGLAKLAGSTKVTKTGTSVGTVAYMSPEQARGEDVDHRTDIWSLGVVLYEMLAGRLPFRGDHEQALIYLILHEDPEPLISFRSDIPDALRQAVGKALEKNRSNRYQDVQALLEDLKIASSPGMILPKHEKSIVVLPFEDISPGKDNEYFSDGLTEEIISDLSQVHDLRVISRNSAMMLKGTQKDTKTIGRELNVQHILEGSVRKAGNNLRITAQLIDATRDKHIWAEKYKGTLDDIFDIQEKVSHAIVDALMLKLTADEKKSYTKNFDAYTWYLKGRFYWNKRSEDGLKKGMEYFEQAIEEDPDYALAYAGLADSYNLLGFYDVLPPEQVFPKAKAAAERSIAMDGSLAEAYTSLGFAKMLYDWDWEGAERAFKRSIELNPNYPTAHHWYAEYLILVGRTDEVTVRAARALQSDPLSLVINTLLGWVPYFERRYKDAEEQYKKTLEMDSGFVPAHFFLGLAYLHQSMYDEALAEFELAGKLFGRSTLFTLARAYARALSGARFEAEEILEEMSALATKDYVSPYFTAVVYSGLGDSDRVFEWLDRACEQHDIWVVFLRVDPTWDDLRSDPRFAALLERVGLRA